jgi:hypothetical protein
MRTISTYRKSGRLFILRDKALLRLSMGTHPMSADTEIWTLGQPVREGGSMLTARRAFVTGFYCRCLTN